MVKCLVEIGKVKSKSNAVCIIVFYIYNYGINSSGISYGIVYQV